MDEKCTMLLSTFQVIALLSMLLAVGFAVAILAIPTVLAAGSIYPSPAFVETTITVKEREAPCDGPVIDAELVVRDLADNVITQTTVGSQVLIEGSVTMDCFQYPDDSQTTIFEVRDEQDITTYFAWQMLSEDSGGQITTGLSWTPDKPGTYEVRFFPLVCLNCPMVLSKIVTYEITVV